MLVLPEDMKVLVSVAPVDMRKSIDGLTLLVVDVLKQNPQSRYLFLFRNQAFDKVKGLYWDKNGFVLIYKRLEKSKFGFPKKMTESVLEIDAKQLSWLLAGFEFMRMKDYPELDFSSYG